MAFPTVTMESASTVCVREIEEKQLAVVDLSQPGSAPQRRPMAADSVIMHPTRRVLAVKLFANNQETLQIFDLDAKAKLKAHALAEQVVLWKWADPDTVALVTATAVYHWSLSGDGEPAKVFDRAPNLAGCQVTQYKVSDDGKWCVLVGIAAGAPERPALVRGRMQLWSVAQGRTQALDAHAASFGRVKIPGRPAADPPSLVLAFAQRAQPADGGPLSSKLHIVELGAPPGGGGPSKKQQELFFPPGFDDDFPVGLHVTPGLGLVLVVTKMGLCFAYDAATASPLHRGRVSAQPVFLSQLTADGKGVLALNRAGQALRVAPDEAALVSFVASTLNLPGVALDLARRGGLPGAERLAAAEFERLAAANEWKSAAELAADTAALRTPATLARLKAAAGVSPPPLLQYLGALLSRGSLNGPESSELASLVVAQGKAHLLIKWQKEGKLAPSESLGDSLAAAGDADAALDVYRAAVASGQGGGSQGKAVSLLASKGDFAALQQMAGAGGGGGPGGGAPDYLYLLQVLLKDNPDGAVALAQQLAKQSPPPVAVPTMSELFFQRNLVKEGTAFLLEALEGDREEHAALQTQVIEVNLVTHPQVADAILSSERFSHYDRPRVAQLCERAGLYARALQHYSELADIRRCIVNTHAMKSEDVVEYFGSLSAEWALDCLGELLKNPAQNLQVVVDAAREYRDQLGQDAILAAFDKAKCPQGVFHFLASAVGESTDPDVHSRYVEAAAIVGNVAEVERMTRESDYLDAPRLKTFLMEHKLPGGDMRPLINVCDRHDMVYDMASYLHKQNMPRYIEGFCQKVAPAKTGEVCAALLDLDADPEFVSGLVTSVRSLLAVAPLVAEFEKRGKLRQLSPFLERVVNEGSVDVEVHNALGKIMIETNNNPEHFVLTNPYYDAATVGKFAEKKDPQLACTAYQKGECDAELLACTNKHSLFKIQARYVVGRKDAELWKTVLSEDNEHRRHLVDQAVGHALPECKDPEQVSTAVKAFMGCGLQSELIELLEKIVLGATSFSSNANLQNLLLLTAIRTPSANDRVLDYARRLDKFDGASVAEIAADHGLFEEAYEIYVKSEMPDRALGVLLDHLHDLERALEYAAKVNEPACWSRAAKALLAGGRVPEAVSCYLKAEDASAGTAFVEAAETAGAWGSLVSYLRMCRKHKPRDAHVDSELVFALARTGDMGALEAFLGGSHAADVEACGDRCRAATNPPLLEYAALLFRAIPAWGKLASTLVALGDWTGAVDAARRAGQLPVWKLVCFACVDAGEFRLASLCGLQLLSDSDALDELVAYYLERGHVDEVLALLEAGLGSDKAAAQVFTELGALYARFKPDALLEHLRLHVSKLNVPRLLRVAETCMRWEALAFLHAAYEEHDRCLQCMMEHSPDAWDHTGFKEAVAKVSIDLYYKAIDFYLLERPALLGDLLKTLELRVDHGKVVALLQRRGLLALARGYLLTAQQADLAPLNEAVNRLLVEEEDADALAESVASYPNFDQLALAARLDSHPVTKLRRVAVGLYTQNKRWDKALALCKREGLWKDAIRVGALSKDKDLVENELLRPFVAEGKPRAFAATLVDCYDLVRPDVVMELAWKHGLTVIVQPFMIQQMMDMRRQTDELLAFKRAADAAEAERREREEAEEKARGFVEGAYTAPLAIAAPSALMGGAPPPAAAGW